MARRISGSAVWARMAQRQTRWILQRAVSEGKKALKRSTLAVATARKAALCASTGGTWGTGVATGPAGMRRYRLFVPSGLFRANVYPLIVMLHGCGQSAAEFAASTRMNHLAALYGFMVLYPEQDRLANAQACWNWFDTRNGRAKLEAASIVAALDHACSLHPIDTSRVAIAGLSAGPSMAALAALHFPQRFAAVVMHSGVEPASANSSATALAAMRGHYRLASPLPSNMPMVLPALMVIQGSVDPVVRRGKRYPVTTMGWFAAKRGLQVTLSEINGLGHAWSGGSASYAYSDPKGPDASRMVWAFAQRQFQLVASAI